MVLLFFSQGVPLHERGGGRVDQLKKPRGGGKDTTNVLGMASQDGKWYSACEGGDYLDRSSRKYRSRRASLRAVC